MRSFTLGICYFPDPLWIQPCDLTARVLLFRLLWVGIVPRICWICRGFIFTGLHSRGPLSDVFPPSSPRPSWSFPTDNLGNEELWSSAYRTYNKKVSVLWMGILQTYVLSFGNSNTQLLDSAAGLDALLKLFPQLSLGNLALHSRIRRKLPRLLAFPYVAEAESAWNRVLGSSFRLLYIPPSTSQQWLFALG
ncbi:uncharacterized protein [Musca autumnalis]|uniref:uncharacterized protein n=1 Tax=Musca autumnalis TaxID=221902 RepID=UPI003CEAC817